MNTKLPVITTVETRPREGENSPFKGGMTWFSLFDSTKTPTTGLTVGVAEIPPQGQGVAHWHEQEELYYILDGHGHMEIDKLRYDVKVGHAIFVPGDAVHNIFNASNVAMKILYVFPVNSLSEVVYKFENGLEQKL